MRKIEISKTDLVFLLLNLDKGRNLSISELLSELYNKNSLNKNVSCFVGDSNENIFLQVYNQSQYKK